MSSRWAWDLKRREASSWIICLRWNIIYLGDRVCWVAGWQNETKTPLCSRSNGITSTTHYYRWKRLRHTHRHTYNYLSTRWSNMTARRSFLSRLIFESSNVFVCRRRPKKTRTICSANLFVGGGIHGNSSLSKKIVIDCILTFHWESFWGVFLGVSKLTHYGIWESISRWWWWW